MFQNFSGFAQFSQTFPGVGLECDDELLLSTAAKDCNHCLFARAETVDLFLEGCRSMHLVEVYFSDDVAFAYAGSLCNAAAALVANGATEVYACASHGVLSGKAYENINKSCIQKLLFTDSMPGSATLHSDRIEYVSLDTMLATAIQCIHNEQSIFHLFP